MLRCCAGICGSGGASERGGGTAPAGVAGGGAVAAPVRVAKKPVVRVGEAYAPEVSTLAELGGFGLDPAPPGADPPLALVTANFRKNPSRLLVLLPSPGAPWGVWDESLGGDRGATLSLQRWAAANDFAFAILNSEVLQTRPTFTWDEVMKGSPSRFVAVLVANGSFPMLGAALKPLHPLLYSRVRAVIASPGSGEALPPTAEASADYPEELRRLLSTTVQMPEEWLNHGAFVTHQCMFQMLEERFDRWQKSEMTKYVGFQGLKENDMPGLKRMNLHQRIQRLDRDRTDDELARLLKKHEKDVTANEEEPGVD